MESSLLRHNHHGMISELLIDMLHLGGFSSEANNNRYSYDWCEVFISRGITTHSSVSWYTELFYSLQFI